MRIKKLLSRKQKKLKEELIEYEIRKIGRQLAGEMIKNYDPEWPDPELTKKEKELLAARYEVTRALADERKIRRYKKRDFLFFKYWPGVYQKGCKKPIDEKLALFVNDHYDTLPDNMQDIYEKLSQMGYTCELLLKPKAPDKGLGKQFVYFLYYRKFTKRYARAKFVFFTEYFMPLYANKPRKGTHTVQLWHASGAFKKFGYSTADTSWGMSRETMEKFPIHNTYTDVFVSAPKVVEAYDDAFHCGTDIIRPLGTPRTDEYYAPGRVERGRAAVEKLCPGINGRKIILYAPTFRGNSIKKSYIHSAGMKCSFFTSSSIVSLSASIASQVSPSSSLTSDSSNSCSKSQLSTNVSVYLLESMSFPFALSSSSPVSSRTSRTAALRLSSPATALPPVHSHIPAKPLFGERFVSRNFPSLRLTNTCTVK